MFESSTYNWGGDYIEPYKSQSQYLSEDFDWFVRNYYKLYDQFGDCFLIISSRQVLNICKTFREAVEWTNKNCNIETVLIQQIAGEEHGYTAYLNSLMRRVLFNKI